MIKLLEGKLHPNVTIRVRTPAAPMFVNITEDEFGKPIAIFINAGKAGSEISAVVDSYARMATSILEKDDGFNELLQHLSGITSDRVKSESNGIKVHSCAEGLYVALVKYRQAKYNEIEQNIGEVDYKPTVFNYRNHND